MSSRSAFYTVLAWSLSTGLAVAAARAAVRDRAALFSPGAAQQAEAEIAQTQRAFHVRVVVDAYAAPPGTWLSRLSLGRARAMDAGARDRYFAQLAARWAPPGSVYVFICTEPAPVQVHVVGGHGSDVARAFGPADCAELRQRILSLLAEHRPDEALLEAATFVRQTAASHRGAEPAEDALTWTVVLEGALLLVGVWLLLEAARAFRRGHGPLLGEAPTEALGLGGSILSGLFALLAGPLRASNPPLSASCSRDSAGSFEVGSIGSRPVAPASVAVPFASEPSDPEVSDPFHDHP